MKVETKEVINKFGFSSRQIYYWELKGYIKPDHRAHGSREFKVFTDEDVKILRGIKYYYDEGYRLDVAAKKAKDNNAIPKIANALEAIRIIDKYNHVNNDLQMYLSEVANWGLGELAEKPDPKVYGIDV